MTLAPGTRLGPYEVLSPLGAGGMGEVYRARDTRLPREVAVKVLPAEVSRDPGRLQRFEQEAHAVAVLNHPNVLTLYDVGVREGAPFVVSELLEGETLRTRLAVGPLLIDEALDYAIQIAQGLAAAHEKGIVHRDLKPANLFLTRDGRAKVLDFGLAKLMGPEPSSPGSESATGPLETAPGIAIGTVGYMAPEQVRGQATDHRSDLFAFGTVLYEMVTGRRAFQGATPADTASAILKDEPPRLAESRLRVPSAVDAIVRRCLEKTPEKRFQSARDLAFALNAARSLASERVRGRRVWALGAAVLAGLAVAWVGARWWSGRPAPVARIGSVAVLPLANLSGDPEEEYFADGMTDTLIGSLTGIRGLLVIARTSVMQYKGVARPVPEIARELGVDALVRGSVRRVGSRVRVSAELVGASEVVLWAGSLEQDASDVLVLHSEMAHAIARAVRLAGPAEDGVRSRPGRVDPQAHEAYLKGRFHWQKQTHAGVRKAIEHFEETLGLQPSHAGAYAGLADCYILLSWVATDPLPPRDAYPKARAAALKALELDDGLAEAHTSLGLVRWRFDWDFPAAGRELRRALDLHPGEATTHHWYGLFLASQGRHPEATREMQRAQNLDPLSRLISTNTGWALYFAGRYHEAAEQQRKTLRSWPDFAPAHYHLGLTHDAQGALEEAAGELRKARALSGDLPYLLSAEGHALARAGRRAEAQERLATLRSHGLFAPSLAAAIHVGLGEAGPAMDWLQQAVEYRDAYLVFLEVNPIWDPLRRDPRFQEIARRIGFRPAPWPVSASGVSSPRPEAGR
jgi:eukaryotic-like serine/threonine-protein kinase